ncbi:MAG: HyaD/HybD family hydrogenase maturation endopeptidase [Burkholderiales bacterium]|nr:MAG: HyaD/HybD family hydrogenase maturation endopeptidase [Burkholderiales bacterium]
MAAGDRFGAPAGGALVLGIGNVLWADEGFGVRAVEALHDAYGLPESVELLDGGTQGLNLLEPLVSHEAVLVLDAIDFQLAPGSLRVLRGREVPAWAGTKMSLHQQSFHELLAIVDLQGRFPSKLTLIGVQPERLADFGGSLSECVRARLPLAVELAVRELAAWGFPAQPRSGRAPQRLNAEALALESYESGRPAESEACRIGDARFLNRRHTLESR